MGELQHWLVVEKADGSRAVLSVYKDGGTLRIVQGDGEPTIVGRGRTVEREVSAVYRAEIIRTVMPADGYPSLD